MRFLSSLTILVFNIIYVHATLRVSMQQIANEKVRVVVANTGDEDIRLLNRPNGVLRASQPTDKFTFAGVDGSQLPSFSGILVKWNPDVAKALEEAYITIPAQRSVNFDHDLSASYTFVDSTSQQRFTISVTESALFTRETLIQFPAPSLTITISPRPQSAMRKKILLTLSTADAQDYASAAWGYIRFLPFSSKRYPEWFGTVTDSRQVAVSTCLSNLRSLDFQNYDCAGSKCNAGDFAYVFKGRPDLGVFLCDQYWAAPDIGTNSQAGTLLHEASHLMCDTSDSCYGHDSCNSLAKRDPDTAIKTADCYEYFSENEPPLG